MQNWEYTVADFTKLEKAVPELDRLGAEGWEAVGLISTWGAGWQRLPSSLRWDRRHRPFWITGRLSPYGGRVAVRAAPARADGPRS